MNNENLRKEFVYLRSTITYHQTEISFFKDILKNYPNKVGYTNISKKNLKYLINHHIQQKEFHKKKLLDLKINCV